MSAGWGTRESSRLVKDRADWLTFGPGQARQRERVAGRRVEAQDARFPLPAGRTKPGKPKPIELDLQAEAACCETAGKRGSEEYGNSSAGAGTPFGPGSDGRNYIQALRVGRYKAN